MKKVLTYIVLLSIFFVALLTILYLGLGISKKITINLYEFDWSGVSGIMDIIMVLLTIILLIGLRQGSKSIDESTRSRNAELLNWAMEEMTKLKPEIKIVTEAHKREPYSPNIDNLNIDYVSSWSKEELSAAQTVSVALQRMGYFAIHDLVSKNHFLNLWGPLYLSCWYSLEGWVKHKRLQLDEPFELTRGAYSRLYFEKYAIYCEDNLPKLLLDNTRKQFGLTPMTRPMGISKWMRNLRASLINKVDI